MIDFVALKIIFTVSTALILFLYRTKTDSENIHTWKRSIKNISCGISLVFIILFFLDSSRRIDLFSLILVIHINFGFNKVFLINRLNNRLILIRRIVHNFGNLLGLDNDLAIFVLKYPEDNVSDEIERDER